ncbi:MAG: DoxX family protein [Betaproteobacteria bacterium]|nr:DoxX family protein [Betaproteobacteria bacterium]
MKPILRVAIWTSDLHYCANRIGEWVAPLGLRLLLAYEFLESGLEKFHGENWFADIQDRFPFPFSLIPPEISWQIATWTELLGPVALALGLATRLTSVSLVVLTVVAWVSVHAGNGYNVAENGWKLPLIYLIMFTPLLLNGAGRLSLDHVVARCLRKKLPIA